MKLSQLSLADYNQLDSIPVINQDLSASGFTPVANTYYRHTGATTATFTQGVIYLYDTAYHKLGESGGTTLNRYEVTLTGGSSGLEYQDVAFVYKIRGNCKGDFKICPDIPNLGVTYNTYAIPIHITGSSTNAYIVLEYATVDSAKNIMRDYYIFGTGGKGYRRYRTSFDNDNPASSTTYYEDTSNQKIKIVYYNDTEISRY